MCNSPLFRHFFDIAWKPFPNKYYFSIPFLEKMLYNRKEKQRSSEFYLKIYEKTGVEFMKKRIKRTLNNFNAAALFQDFIRTAAVYLVATCLALCLNGAEVLNEKADIVNPTNPDYDVPDGSITFKNVNFRYNQTSEKPILENINIHINSGETIGIMGGTGSAKSSFVNLISRLYDIEPPADENTESYLLVGGKDVKSYDLDTLRQEVSVVLQKNVLFSGSILDNLRWGDPNATEEECIRACKLACADEFIEKMPDKYNTHIEQGGANVSGGQKQRLCIARALLKKPKILILDDSTSAVDTLTDSRIRKAFKKEIPDTTKIIIAQRISSIMDADRIIVLDDGKINGIGTHNELLENNEIYREVYMQQSNDNGDFDKKGGEA